MNIFLACLVLIVAGLCYFLPAIIGRKKKNATAIAFCNPFFGWTIAGWVVCLIWALSGD
ncbi:superinfection immunity protein [Mucilaginibacter sp.]|uniref:superinfection immunity protein n=1 Tax=Mucilaginibacter sp. TaxID=1882438 RepID=UPI00260466E0|nr:superinfection immunity protein [Mucilaginibacter sp.]